MPPCGKKTTVLILTFKQGIQHNVLIFANQQKWRVKWFIKSIQYNFFYNNQIKKDSMMAKNSCCFVLNIGTFRWHSMNSAKFLQAVLQHTMASSHIFMMMLKFCVPVQNCQQYNKVAAFQPRYMHLWSIATYKCFSNC